MNKSIMVFVYGTLRTGESNHSLLKGAVRIAKESWTYGTLYDTGFGYPAMVKDHAERVYGEVYEVTESQLQQLDRLEGYYGVDEMNHYNRITQTIYTDDGPVQAYIYVYENDQAVRLTKIPSGDWKCHCYLSQEEILYFAYGSCMDDERFKQAGVNHLFQDIQGCGIARDYSLAFTRKSSDGGRADMIESNSWVEGKVYKINNEALTYLFKREGANINIYRPAFITLEIDGAEYENVLTFLVIDKEYEETAPPEHYWLEIIRGAKDFVSREYYDKLVRELWEKFDIEVVCELEVKLD